jgi:hypothetical protein
MPQRREEEMSGRLKLLAGAALASGILISVTRTTPVLVEICIGLEINGYMPADGYVPPES